MLTTDRHVVSTECCVDQMSDHADGSMKCWFDAVSFDELLGTGLIMLFLSLKVFDVKSSLQYKPGQWSLKQ